MKKQSPFATDRGQSLVEIALVLPILIILFLGIAEVGFYLFSHIQVANAARAGAREGSLCRLYGTCGALSSNIQTAVFSEASSLNMNTGNTHINLQPVNPGTNPAVGTPITVTVVYTHISPIVSNFIPMFPSQLPVRHTVIMRFDK